MISLQLFHLFTFSCSLTSASILLHPDGHVPNVFTDCKACAPIERLRTPTYGIELSPEYITVAIKHANGTLAPLLKVQPGYEFYEILMGWMALSGSVKSVPELQDRTPAEHLDQKVAKLAASLSVEALMRRHHEHQVLTSEIRNIVETTHNFYPELELTYGGVAIPDYIYRDSTLRSWIVDALRESGLRNPRSERFFQLYPADFAIVADTATQFGKLNFSVGFNPEEDSSFDAVVIANTSTYMSASWYQFSFRQNSIGQIAIPQVEFSRTYDPDRLEQEVLEVRPASSTARTLQMTQFVAKREVDYQKRTGSGKRIMSGNSKMILRFDAASDNANPELTEWLDLFLKHTRFNPTSLKTTVYREEKDDWIWTPALSVARDMKLRVDYGEPFGCIEPPFCEEVKACVQREALGELIICEDTAIPETPLRNRIERGVENGYWKTYTSYISPWLSVLFSEAEARIWLWYCRSDPSSSPLCKEALEPISETVMGVFEGYLDTTNTLIETAARYWITGSITVSLLEIPLYWTGWENLLKIGFWTVSHILGPEMWKSLVEMSTEIWESDLKAIWDAWDGEL